MSFDFMKPDIWDGLVIGVTLVGIALAILRIMSDRAAYERRDKPHTNHETPNTNDHETR
jgi:hypothetical protein